MKRGQRVLLVILGAALIGAAAGEYFSRRVLERRHRDAITLQQRTEQGVRAFLSAHGRLKQDLEQERKHSQELSQTLAMKQTELDEAVGRLTEETTTVRKLEMRLAAMQQQMDQLQSELALALGERQGGAQSAKSAGTVALERIVVSDARAPRFHGRVLSVHKDWNFVVIDLGWDAVKIGETVSIERDGRLLAQARVERVQEGLSAATLLPGWESADVQTDDLVRSL